MPQITSDKHDVSQAANIAASYLNELDIDSSLFDHDAFLQRLYGNLGLDQLDQVRGQLHQEEKRLTGEMRALVYQNYDKFIKVQETLIETKIQMTSVLDTLKEFRTAISKLSTECDNFITDNPVPGL